MGIGAPELMILLLVVVLLFGASKLPKLARSMGEASREFRKGVNEADKDDAPAALKAEAKTEAKVTMTQAELDALLAAEREAGARKDAPPTS